MNRKKTKQNNAYDYHDTFDHDGIAVVGKNGKFGYVRKSGEEITPLKYDKAMRFYWCVGKVCINGKWGLVDMSGKEITPLIYDEIKGHQAPIAKLHNKYGYINRKTGELLTPIKYDHACQWTQCIDFSDDHFDEKDLAAVQLDGKWGCINPHGEEIVPLKYDKIAIHQSTPCYVAASINEKWGFIDNTGTEITLFEYDSVNEFNEHRACVEKNGKYGFIDDKGALVIPIIYDDCEQCFWKKGYSDDADILPVVVELNGKYGYIDVNGNEIVKPVYEYAASFYGGKSMAAVMLNGKIGFIDETGKEVIPLIYDPPVERGDTNWNHYSFNNFANVKLNGKWGVIDKNNKVVLPFLYDNFLENQHAGWRYAIRDGKKLSIDTKGNERLMQKNPGARTFKDYLHVVKLPEVVKCGRSLLNLSKEEVKNLKINFDNFLTKKPSPSQNIIRIHLDYGGRDWAHPPIDAALYNVEDECSYMYVDWEEILDMEVRIEDNLTLSDAEVVAVCIWEACDQRLFLTEEKMRNGLDRLEESCKTEDENMVER
jgi:hypothetical protein